VAGAELLSPGPGATEGVSALRAVKAVFGDENVKTNVLLGIVFMLIPIVGPMALSGWMCEVHQRLLRRHPNPMPKIDFNDFGEYIKRGIPVFLTSLLVTVPVLFVVYAVMGAGAFAVFAGIAATGEPLVGIGIGAVMFIVLMLFSLALGVIVNAVHTRAELTEDFGESMKMGKLMAYSKATFGTVVVKNISFMFIAFGIVLVGILLCYLGLYPAIVVVQIAAMHLRHQIYVDYLAKGGEQIPLKAPQALPSEARAPGY
jgi:small-conductance mechanosensitive channel